nr:GH32 C-terminal domain-containing protein [Enorma phocaeensis]
MQHAVGPDADDADDTARDLRVLVDASAVEVYANGGRDVLSTRWFPVAEELSVALHGSCAAGHVWAMGDGMAGTY